MGTRGGARTRGLSLRRAALYPLSYPRVTSPSIARPRAHEQGDVSRNTARRRARHVRSFEARPSCRPGPRSSVAVPDLAAALWLATGCVASRYHWRDNCPRIPSGSVRWWGASCGAQRSPPLVRGAAEEEGFEPSTQVSPGNRLAGGRTRPLCDSSRNRRTRTAEGEGFEPPGREPCGFQDRRIKPLCHPSGMRGASVAISIVERQRVAQGRAARGCPRDGASTRHATL